VSGAGAVQDPAGLPITTAASFQEATVVAWNGTNFLVAWMDSRSGTNSDVYGARVNAAGVVQDPADIPISTNINDQHAPALAWDGTNYLVAWEDSRSGTSSDIYGARVSAAGAVQDASGIPISTATSDQISPTLAWDGTNFLVAWIDLRSGPTYDIYGTRVSAAGAVQNSAGIPISTAADNQYFPALEWDGTNFLVAWQDFRSGTSFDIYGARVSGAGAVQDATGIPISTAASDQLRPALAWNGSNYLVAWEDLRSGTTLDIYGARVSAAGAVQDAAGIPISTAANHQAYPDLAWDSTNYLVVWTDFRVGTGDIYGTRVNTAGAVQDAAGIPISTAAGNQLSPALAWDGSNHLVAWEDARSGSDVYGARVSAAGAVQDGAGVALAASAASESAPAVTSGPAGRAAVVYRHRPSLISANPQITLRFFDEDPASVLCGRSLPTLAGDQGADTLTGTPDDDVIVGLGGNDTIEWARRQRPDLRG